MAKKKTKKVKVEEVTEREEIEELKEYSEEERPESCMIVPYISNKTFPDYVRMMIESYDWMPEMVHYVQNDVRAPLYQQKFDWKATEVFKKVKPKKYYIFHASDNWLMPEDLGRMKQMLDDDPKAFCVGIYPIGAHMAHNKLFTDFVMPTRIVIWKAEILEKFLDQGMDDAKKAFTGVPLDSIYFVAQRAIQAGYHSVIDAKARFFKIDNDEFRTFWVNPTVG